MKMHFLAIAAVAMGMTACGGSNDANTSSQESQEVIEVTDTLTQAQRDSISAAHQQKTAMIDSLLTNLETQVNDWLEAEIPESINDRLAEREEHQNKVAAAVEPLSAIDVWDLSQEQKYRQQRIVNKLLREKSTDGYDVVRKIDHSAPADSYYSEFKEDKE